MNNIIISTIRFGLVFGIALTAFVGDVFAAPTLTPVSVERYGATSVSLYANASTPEWAHASVWFEYGENPNNSGTAVGMATVFSRGGTMEPFIAKVYDLKPGATYYFRAVAIQGGATVTSPVTTYVVPGSASTTTTSSNTSTQQTQSTQTTTTTKSPEVVVINHTVTTPAKQVVVTQKTTTATAAKTTPIVEKENVQGASVIGSTNEALPQTLVGWIALFITLLLILLVFRMILDAGEARKLAQEREMKRHYEENEPKFA